MNFVDLEQCKENVLMEADICIIGSGPVGLFIAKEFEDTDLNILILESGGLELEEASNKLYEIESVGDPRRINQCGNAGGRAASNRLNKRRLLFHLLFAVSFKVSKRNEWTHDA